MRPMCGGGTATAGGPVAPVAGSPAREKRDLGLRGAPCVWSWTTLPTRGAAAARGSHEVDARADREQRRARLAAAATVVAVGGDVAHVAERRRRRGGRWARRSALGAASARAAPAALGVPPLVGVGRAGGLAVGRRRRRRVGRVQALLAAAAVAEAGEPLALGWPRCGVARAPGPAAAVKSTQVRRRQRQRAEECEHSAHE